MQRFKSACSAQKLLSAHTSVHNTFTVKCFSPQFNHIACSAPRRKLRPSTVMSRLSVSFGYLRYSTANDRNRAESNDSLAAVALMPGSLCR
jgi:hypothetical protein